MTKPPSDTTTERFLATVRDLILASADLKPDERDALARVKLTYGMGNGTYRGVTAYGAWKHGEEPTDFVEIAASAQESWIQLAGTVTHELGHSLAGFGSGHGGDWKAACVRLGFRIKPAAAGQRYCLAMFGPALRQAIYQAAKAVGDGSPAFAMFGAGVAIPGMSATPRPCRAGQGTRGGTSRGTGSGSRLRLWECECERPVKVRIASDDFQATCNRCGSAFTRK